MCLWRRGIRKRSVAIHPVQEGQQSRTQAMRICPHIRDVQSTGRPHDSSGNVKHFFHITSVRRTSLMNAELQRNSSVRTAQNDKTLMDILDINERHRSICWPPRIPSHLCLAAGGASGTTYPLPSSLARERRPCSNRTVEAVIGCYFRARRMFNCGQHLVSTRKTLQRQGAPVHLQNVARTGLMRAPD